MPLRTLLIIWMAASLLMACHHPWGGGDDGPCLDGMKVGDRYTISVGAARPDILTCPPNFDLVQGTRLVATVTRLESDGDKCADGIIEIAPLGAWSWVPNPEASESDGGRGLVAGFLATNGTCTGRVGIAVVGNQLGRRWVPEDSSGGCPENCYDTFVASVEKLP
jgi:hypothetical protein